MNNAIIALVIVVVLAAGAFFLLQGKQQAAGGTTGGGTAGGGTSGGDSMGMPGTEAGADDISSELNSLLDGDLAAVSTDAADSEFGTTAESDISDSLGDSYQ